MMTGEGNYDEAAARGLLWQRTRGLVIGAEETR